MVTQSYGGFPKTDVQSFLIAKQLKFKLTLISYIELGNYLDRERVSKTTKILLATSKIKSLRSVLKDYYLFNQSYGSFPKTDVQSFLIIKQLKF